jgi:hypothetical protein
MVWTTEVRFPAGAEMGIFSSSLQHPDRLWGSLDVLSSGYQGGSKSGQGVKLITHLQLVPKYVEMYLHFPISLHGVMRCLDGAVHG